MKKNHFNLAQNVWRVILAILVLCSFASAITLAQAAPPPPDPTEDFDLLEQIELGSSSASSGLATADDIDPHGVYAWPFNVDQMGHAIQSYQNYSSSPYFHHGIDMIAPNGTDVFNRSGGQVVNVENYQPGNDLYWEVAIKDPDGFIWQYHHIDKNTIPQAIKDKFAEYQSNPTTGGFIPTNTYIGDIVYWTVVTFGYRFNHIHLNILGAGNAYVNPMEFHPLLNDTQLPEIQQIGLLFNNTVNTGNTVSGEYGLYVRARDLFLSSVFYLPPYHIEFALDGGAWTTVWKFENLPGGASDTTYVSDFYVVPPTCGNYDCRDFYIDLGFVTTAAAGEYGAAAQRAFPNTMGEHNIQVRVWDYNGNSDTDSFTWWVYSPYETTSSGSITDNSCTGGTGLTRTFNVTEEMLVTDVNLGLNVTHASRGQLQVTLKAPGDAAATTIVSTISDTNDNYDLLIADGSTNNINDSSNDATGTPYYEADRRAGPRPDGSLDSFDGRNSLGTWTLYICDGSNGTAGSLNRARLALLGNYNRAPLASLGVSSPINISASTLDLSGSITDDGLPKTPGQVTSAWSMLNGPAGGMAYFTSTQQTGAAPQTHNTTVGFSQPGSYTLQLTPSDGVLSGTPVQIVVNADFTPTAVSIASFSANFVAPQAVRIDWSATGEGATAGYNLYRATSLTGERVRVNPAPIPVQLNPSTNLYTYLDLSAPQGVPLYYWLARLSAPDDQEVLLDDLPPAEASPRSAWIYIPIIRR